MIPRQRDRRDDGSAIIEFVIVGICVLLPIIYAVLCVMTVHAAAFASTQAVREAGRVFVASSDEGSGRRNAQASAQLAFADQGLQLPPGALMITCESNPCLAPGSSVVVAVHWSVALPLLPQGRGSAKSLPISAEQTLHVDDFRRSA